jgi:hypothetical protein
MHCYVISSPISLSTFDGNTTECFNDENPQSRVEL